MTNMEIMKKINNTPKRQGWYEFEDGLWAWYHGMSAAELKREIRIHGKVTRFKPTFEK